jgi:hypothetical protein
MARSKRELPLTASMERYPARGQDLLREAGREQYRHRTGNSSEQVFAVVERQEDLSAGLMSGRSLG